MKKQVKKLKVRRETLRDLGRGLEEVAGAATGRSDCQCPVLSIGDNCITRQWTSCPFC